jgi:hypothetical protein
MARIEDGIFTKACTTTGDINAAYDIHAETRPATQDDLDLIGNTIGVDGQPVTAIGDPIYGTPAMAGLGARVYTSNYEGSVTFKLFDNSEVTMTVFRGTSIPLATKGCNKTGLIILG